MLISKLRIAATSMRDWLLPSGRCLPPSLMGVVHGTAIWGTAARPAAAFRADVLRVYRGVRHPPLPVPAYPAMTPLRVFG
eukprot:719033-Prymnesium_polylepis.1